MTWYAWILIGIVIGLVISRYLPSMVQINGTIKQKGWKSTNTIRDVKTNLNKPKKEIFSRFKNKRKLKKEKR
jgi:uncharacterized membrane-anchored protein YhcB (DUF1043 family)